MVNELAPLEEVEELADSTEEIEPEVESQADDGPNELEALRAEVEALKQNQTVVEDLKRSVGRIQSLAEKFSNASTDTQRAELQKQIDDRFRSIEGQLGDVVSGLDDTVLDPATRQRILNARTAAEQAAAVQRAVDEAIAKRSPQPAPQATQTQASPLEQELVSTIEAAGLDPDGPLFDWAAMSKMVVDDRTGRTVRAHVLGKILEARAEESAASRRTAAKQQAGGGAPRPVSAGLQVNSMEDADAAYSRGEITHEKYREYRGQFGVSARPGGGR